MEQGDIVEALERGDLVRMLAEVECGRITPEQMVAAIDEYDRRHWTRRLFRFLFG